MTLNRKRLKSNMLRAVVDAPVLLIGITLTLTSVKVKPPNAGSVFGILPNDGPSGKIMG